MRATKLGLAGLGLAAISLLAVSVTPLTNPVKANDDRNRRDIAVVPSTFVGTAAQCGGTAGSRIVTAAWLTGFGLPDNGGLNGVPSTANDPHMGLLLSKNGPTTDCSAAQADVTGVEGMTLTELGFDYRNGGHCGAGAPRFNIYAADGSYYFAGCASGAQSPAPQDLKEWTRVRFSATAGTVYPADSSFPAFVFGPNGTRITGLEIVFDEGTDTQSSQDPNGVGLASLDNIDVNGTLVTSGPTTGRERSDCKPGNGNGDKNRIHCGPPGRNGRD